MLFNSSKTYFSTAIYVHSKKDQLRHSSILEYSCINLNFFLNEQRNKVTIYEFIEIQID
jgi:hypothetical protein